VVTPGKGKTGSLEGHGHLVITAFRVSLSVSQSHTLTISSHHPNSHAFSLRQRWRAARVSTPTRSSPFPDAVQRSSTCDVMGHLTRNFQTVPSQSTKNTSSTGLITPTRRCLTQGLKFKRCHIRCSDTN
jgi:hypothetical protein